MKLGRPISIPEDVLLNAAQDVLLEKGLDATISEVARRVRISESVIFHRYGTKETFFLAIFERQMKLVPEFDELAGLAGRGDIAGNLFALGIACVEKMRTALPMSILAFSSPVKLGILQKSIRQVQSDRVRILGDYFEAERSAGRLHLNDPGMMAHFFIGGVRQYVFMELFGGTDEHVTESAEEYIRSMIGILLRGIVET